MMRYTMEKLPGRDLWAVIDSVTHRPGINSDKVFGTHTGDFGLRYGFPPPVGAVELREINPWKKSGLAQRHRVWWVAPPHQCVITMKSVSFPVS